MSKHNNINGFTIIELLISMAIGIFLLSASSGFVMRALSVSKVVKSRTLVADLEEQIRLAADHDLSIVYSGNQEDKLEACLEDDGIPCTAISGGKKTITKFSLYRVSGTRNMKLSGSLSAQGGPCASSCPILVEVFFTPECGGPPTCDQALNILIQYNLSIDGDLIRSGAVYHRVQKTEVVTAADGAKTCGLDKTSQLPTFVSGVEPFKKNLTCTEMPGVEHTIAGVTPGDCITGKEVLIGFDPTTKAAICAPVVLTK
ncbi:MAG: PilW family protein [Oligoflexales bacterium]